MTTFSTTTLAPITTAITTPTLTAAQIAYGGHQGEIDQLIADLQRHLANHAERAAEQPWNYGFAGDLGRVEELLEEVVDGLRVRD